MSRVVKVTLLVAAALAAYPLWLGWQIWEQSHRDDPRPADAIVVLGAAQYDGRPSPIYKARLDHAAFLYDERLAPTVITTGGKRAGDRYTEAAAGRNYLVDEGVPAEAVLEEGTGRTSLDSLRRVWEIAEDENIRSVLLVSDPLHSERIERIAEDLGFEDVHVSWASYTQLERSRLTKAKELLREISSLMVYELLDR